MSWYLLRITHGPGHQSAHEEYIWHGMAEEPTQDERREWCDDTINQLQLDYPISHITKVDVLPEDVRLKKVQYYRWRILGAQHMLKILGVCERCDDNGGKDRRTPCPACKQLG